MAGITTNLPEVERSIMALARAFDLRGRSGGRMLGKELMLRIAWAIQIRTLLKQTSPDGRPFAPLSPRYLRWKIRHGFDPRINIKLGRMLSLRQLLGQQTITASRAVMRYGVTESERLKAEWATEGSRRRRRPARPFYDLGAEGEMAVEQALDEALDRAVGGG